MSASAPSPPASSPPRGGRADRLARIHGVVGVALGVWLVHHLWMQWPALESRDAWLARATAHPTRWLGALALAAFVGHAVVGFVRARRRPTAEDAGERGLRRVQLVTGLLTLGFVGYHVVQLGVLVDGPHAYALAPYGALRHAVGRPVDLVVYLVGLGCVAFHLGHGLSRFAEGIGMARGAARALAGPLATALWLGYLHVLGVYAIGEGLFSF